MTTSAAQLRAVAAALTPETIDGYTVGSWLADEFNTDGNVWYLPAFIAATCGNDALRRAVALTLDLEAVRLEQEARHGFGKSCTSCIWEQGLPPCPGCCNGEIATVVRAHWAKGGAG